MVCAALTLLGRLSHPPEVGGRSPSRERQCGGHGPQASQPPSLSPKALAPGPWDGVPHLWGGGGSSPSLSQTSGYLPPWVPSTPEAPPRVWVVGTPGAGPGLLVAMLGGVDLPQGGPKGGGRGDGGPQSPPGPPHLAHLVW
uniref:Uncharacterized protein n=1 Tax=Eutreptiella gymnastica TaxID=73025 RepID=A0A7S1IKG9_9EUGL